MRSNVHPSFPNGDNCSRILFNSDLLRLTYALTPLPLFPPLLRLSLGTAFNFELVNHVFKGLTSILNAGDIEAEVSDDDTNPYAAFFDITALRSIAELLEKMQQCPTNELNAWRHNNPGQVCSSIAFILFVVFFFCVVFSVAPFSMRSTASWAAGNPTTYVPAAGSSIHPPASFLLRPLAFTF